MPDGALRFAEGHAYVLMGIAPGQAPGVEEVDSVELNRGMEAYLGNGSGPLWRAEFVSVDVGAGLVKVLLVDVEPPRWGDPVHFVRKGYDKVKATTVFVRYPGRTEQASVADLDNLNARARKPKQTVRLLVTPAAGLPIRPADIDNAAQHEWLRAETARCGASLRTAAAASSSEQPPTEGDTPGRPAATLLGHDHKRALNQFKASLNQVAAAQAWALGYTPDTRTADQYREEVAQYIAQCSEVLPRIARHRAAALVTPVVLELQNTTQLNLSDIELVVNIPGRVHALPSYPEGADDDVMPPRPRPWGTRQKSAALSGLLVSHDSYQPRFSLHSLIVSRPADPYRPRITNDASGAKITYPLGDLRPHYQVTCHGVAVIVSTPAEPVLEAVWTATCRNHDTIISGRLDLPVMGTPWSLDQLLSGQDPVD
jgi:hypothetical protein